MSACVMLAWCILPLVAVAGSREPTRTAQANISIASYTRATQASEPRAAAKAEVTADPAGSAATWTVRPGDTLSAIAAALAVPGGWQALYAADRPLIGPAPDLIGPAPDLIRPGAVLALPGTGSPARYTVAPGDTLSAIAAALAVPGGWQALYAANRQAIGPNPNAIRPGVVVVAPRPAARGQAARGQAPSRRPQQAPAPEVSEPAPSVSEPAPVVGQSARRLTAPGDAAAPAGGMPRWLEDVLLAAGVLAATVFAAEPAAALARRRRAARPAPPAPPARSARHRSPGGPRDHARQAAAKARIILADHERLIVTYCASDHTVYVLAPPGEDPRAVLKAARLVLPEDTYEDLAGHLGVPSTWPLE
jgi:LysM repeat protein